MNDEETVGDFEEPIGTANRRTVIKGAGVGAVALAGIPAFATDAAAKPGKGRGRGVGGGLVSHYPLNDIKRAGRVHDASPNRNDGTAVGDVSVVKGGGRVGNAYAFDGDDDYVAIPDDSSFGVETVTVSAWVSSGGANNREYIFDGQDHNYLLKEADGTETPRFGVFIGGSFHFVDATGDLSPGTWHHVAGTYDGDELRIYVDGVLADTNGNPSGPIDVSAGESRIGDYLGGGYGYDGLIDEVRIYDQALSPDRISSLAAQGGD